MFDEELGLLFDRAKVLGFDLESLRDSGRSTSNKLMLRSCRRANLPTVLGTESMQARRGRS